MPESFRPSARTEKRTLSRRAFTVGASASALTLVACGDEESPEVDVVPTEIPTQAEPTPTQPPISSPAAGYLDPNRYTGQTVTVATAGAAEFLDALHEAFFDAFERDTGATVEHAEFGRDGTENLAAQVESGEILWDVMLVPASEVLAYADRGMIAAIDYNIVDSTSLYPELTMQHGVGAMMYSTTMVYSVSADAPPADWAEFFDLSTFDGTRALRRSPVGTLEFALMADGVPMDELYPLEVDRAFRKLESIREATLFYEDSKQPIELVRTGQVGLASAWTVRTNLPDAASLVKPQWNQGMISADAWVTPRGSRNADLAMNFINYATRAIPTANFTRLQPFGPVNKDAIPLLRSDIISSLPNSPANMSMQFFENWSYWRDMREPLTAQFEDWLLNPPGTPESDESDEG
ncbi:MAG TPA: extracellular solute-binding protein [Thermomicrobiales bacterium]|nr:extracellular solute-binding protein [Thermomicrobiales bacterium]